jgi:hypothetical protein
LREEGSRVYFLNNGTVWLGDENKGLFAFNKQGNLIYGNNKLFPNFSISGLLEDREGNVWLATLGKGLIVIPNLSFIDFTNHSLMQDDDIQCITSDGDNNIYIAGLKGTVYMISNNVATKFYQKEGKINHIAYLKESNALIFHPTILQLNNKQAYTPNVYLSHIKDVYQLNTHTAVLSTNLGIQYISLNETDNQLLDRVKQLCSTSIKDGRSWCIAHAYTP